MFYARFRELRFPWPGPSALSLNTSALGTLINLKKKHFWGHKRHNKLCFECISRSSHRLSFTEIKNIRIKELSEADCKSTKNVKMNLIHWLFSLVLFATSCLAFSIAFTWEITYIKFFKGTVILIERALISNCSRVSKVSWKFRIPTINNFAVS